MKILRVVPLFLLSLLLFAQQGDPLWRGFRFRQIGPFRGGRVVAVSGVTQEPNTYYFGATGGGVWKTTDGGRSWQPMSDGQFKTGDVGAIAVSESDPNILYVGMGEACIRGNVSNGDGVYKSLDGGKSWRNMGLVATEQIGRVVIHPKNPDIAYVAALGHVWAQNPERGVYRTTDGGVTWKQVLTRGNTTGAVDLAMDPTNPKVIYAGFWDASRKPWRLDSGGPNSGLWKTTDGGDNWTDLSKAPGMPRGAQGRVGVAVSPVNPDRVWAIVEAADGGVFRSDNGGRTWTKMSGENDLRQRAWYYSHIFADPKNADGVYVLNVEMFYSGDAGRTFQPVRPPHGDNHALWVAPDNPKRMIEGNDGGATISTDGGLTWTSQDGQPTAQFYRVALDNDFPYHIYGAQQDNSTVRIASRTTSGGGITAADWYDVGGGESGWIAPDPRDSQIVYAGSYGNLITRQDRHTGQTRNINAWPDNPMGYGADVLKYRFQWSFPILFSPHDPTMLYIGSNVMMKTMNEGQNWEAISPDLTRNDKSKQASSGGPITQDNTSVEYYDTIFCFDESPVTAGVIWAGSDDGLVNVTRDGGKHWENVTPKGMPDWIQINSINASTFDAGTAYVAAIAYKLDDYHPYLFKTNDYGKTWTKIVNGIPERHFTRVVKEDPNRKGLLVAGTEYGLYISFDDGANWKSFQLNLPVVPIADVAFQKRDKELVVATQGRSFYIFDELPLLYQLNPQAEAESAHLFTPKDTYRAGGGRGFGGGRGGAAAIGENPPGGVVIPYWLKDRPQGEVTIEILDATGKQVQKFSSRAAAGEGGPIAAGATEGAEGEAPTAAGRGGRGGRGGGAMQVPTQQGMNRFTWNLRYPDATTFPGMILWAGSTTGPSAVPAAYTVKLTADGKTYTQNFKVSKDPRVAATDEDFAKQLSLALQVRDKVSETNQAVIRIREVKRQLDEFAKRPDKKVADAAKDLAQKLTAVEEELYQTKNRASEDPLNFPIKLNNKLAYVLGVVEGSDNQPTSQSYVVYEDLATEVNAQMKKLNGLFTTDLASFNKLVRDANVPAVELPPAK